jgi:protein TonB
MRLRLALPVSFLTHAGIVAALLALALRGGVDLPEVAATSRAILTFPAAAAAPPPPKGNPGLTRTRPAPARPAVEAVVERPATVVEIAREQPPEQEQAGSPMGSDLGVPEGIEGGKDGGRGVDPNGLVDGCVGCDGEGPATDYDRPPRPLRLTRPVYPQEAFVKKIEGTIRLDILIDASGNVVDARLLERGHPALERAALQTVREWLFVPAMRHGRPVAVWARAPVNFRIY